MKTSLVTRRDLLKREAEALRDVHPSKDCRAFATAVLDYLEAEKQDTLRMLLGSVTARELRGEVVPGCKINPI